MAFLTGIIFAYYYLFKLLSLYFVDQQYDELTYDESGSDISFETFVELQSNMRKVLLKLDISSVEFPTAIFNGDEKPIKPVVPPLVTGLNHLPVGDND